MEVIETWLDGQPSELFLSGSQKFEQWAKKCVELRGECVEYIPSFVAVACSIPGWAKDLPAAPLNLQACHIYQNIRWTHLRSAVQNSVLWVCA
jgi:hypothetical protein